jgi:hypothetical protein
MLLSISCACTTEPAPGYLCDGTTLRIQRCQRLCPVFPESRYWNVRHLGVHSSSPVVCLFVCLFACLIFCLSGSAAHFGGRAATFAVSPSPNGS